MENPSTTQGISWSNEDKCKLLEALNTYGLGDINILLNELPGKSLRDIQVVIRRYERLAHYHPDNKCDDEAPIDQWTKILRMHSDFNRLGPIPRALKYIALFEDRVENDVNLSDIYKMLSDISQGVAPKKLDDCTTNYLYHVFNKLAQDVETDDNSKEKQFLEELCNSLTGKKNYTKRNTKEDILINPLLVPRELYRKKSK